jgi:ankyrin repeat protein
MHSPLEAIRFLAHEWRQALEVRTNEGELALHCAARRGDKALESVQFLAIQRPHALLERTNDGLLPLHCAAQSKASLRIAQFLVEAEPTALHVPSNDGSLPLHYAVAFETEDRPIGTPDPVPLILFLAERGPQALEAGDHRGFRPVHVAAANHAPLDVVYVLLGHPVKAVRAPARSTKTRNCIIDIS